MGICVKFADRYRVLYNLKCMPSGKTRSERRRAVTRRTARQAFREIGIALTSRLELEHVLRSILHQIEALLMPKDSLLYLLDESRKGLVIYPRGRRKAPHSPVLEEGIAGWVIRHGKGVFAKDGQAHPHYSPITDLKVTRENRAICCVPISSGNDVRGALEIMGESFTRAKLEILHTIADFAAVAIENSTYVATIEELTITDDLTGLYNSRYLGRTIDMEIKRAYRYDEEFSLVFVDLDKFKDVNDKYGHLVGSRVLTETGVLISGAMRKDVDSAFRYGGDEFVMVLPKTNPDGAMVVARRIQQMVRNREFSSDGGEKFKLTASIGIAAFPRDATTREEIVRLADEAMYEVKRKGRDGIASGSSVEH